MGKTRQTIKAQTMRELMFASGGRCAMTDCRLSLTSPTGGWIGTVAHIIGAEKDGPRGDSPMTPQDRASFANLILMCATHGREVDAPDTGEANFPAVMLRIMKETHEAKVTAAVEAAISQDLSGVQTAAGAIDTALRPSKAAVTAEGLLESLLLGNDPSVMAKFVAALETNRTDLQRLSQPALDTLSELLRLWLLDCRDHSDGSYSFGDPSDSGPLLPRQNVENRIMQGGRGAFDRAIGELMSRKLIERWFEEEDRTEWYAILSMQQLPTEGSYYYNFWRSTAEFLYSGFGVEIPDWIKGLDFSIFDRVAPADRVVPWR